MARNSVCTGGLDMAGRVEGKVALVTGGASGIGRATALTFAREGAKLVVADMNADGGQQTVHMITEKGGEATFIQVDVTSASAVEAMISQTVETYGRLDCAYNNAGISGRGIAGTHRALTADYPEERWFFFYSNNVHRDLHSFPTRRSPTRASEDRGMPLVA